MNRVFLKLGIEFRKQNTEFMNRKMGVIYFEVVYVSVNWTVIIF